MVNEPVLIDTAKDQILRRLRSEIIRGDYAPGAKLNQTSLGRRFQVSRMPVRDALHALEAEGLVLLDPKRGARVAPVDLERSEKIYAIREVLEVWALATAVPRMTRGQLRHIRGLFARLERIHREHDVSGWLEVDREFHFATYAPLENDELLGIIVELWNATQALRRSYCLLPGALGKALEHHRELMQAIDDGDAEGAAKVERKHIRRTLRAVSAHLNADMEGGDVR